MIAKDIIPEFDKISSRYEDKKAALLPLLHLVQEKEGLVSKESEEFIANYLGMPVVHVHDVVSFYHLFCQKRQGRFHFSVCQTTSCSLLGAEDIVQHLKDRLGINPGETTPDGKFSFNTVECLGACEIAPMMTFNKEYKGFLTKEIIDKLIKENS